MTTDNAAASDIIKINPPETLVFQLEKGISPRAVLLIENTTRGRVIFKVKTTQPTWYYVRPNQSVLDIGEREEVAIVLVDTECDRFIADAALNNAEKVDKHRFLVQAKSISDDQFRNLSALKSSNDKAEEYNRLWEQSPGSDKKVKMKVEFVYPNPDRPSTPKPHKTESTLDHLPSSGGSYESVFTELLSLRKKYDSIVEYTVHVTAERDTAMAELEELKKGSGREGRKTAFAPSRTSALLNQDKKVQQGYSMVSVVVVALVCFFLGKFIKI